MRQRREFVGTLAMAATGTLIASGDLAWSQNASKRREILGGNLTKLLQLPSTLRVLSPRQREQAIGHPAPEFCVRERLAQQVHQRFMMTGQR